MKQLGIEGLGAVWTKVFELLKKITGNVDVQNKGDLQTQINNLIKKIPAAANNGKLTIQKNGTNVQSFTANQNGDATANIIVPNVTRSAAVTQEGQLALDAIEKNASIEGTLANELGKINSKLNDANYYQTVIGTTDANGMIYVNNIITGYLPFAVAVHTLGWIETGLVSCVNADDKNMMFGVVIRDEYGNKLSNRELTYTIYFKKINQ